MLSFQLSVMSADQLVALSFLASLHSVRLLARRSNPQRFIA